MVRFFQIGIITHGEGGALDKGRQAEAELALTIQRVGGGRALQISLAGCDGIKARPGIGFDPAYIHQLQVELVHQLRGNDFAEINGVAGGLPIITEQ